MALLETDGPMMSNHSSNELADINAQHVKAAFMVSPILHTEADTHHRATQILELQTSASRDW